MHIYVCIKEIQNPEIAPSVFRVNEEKKEVIPVPGMPLVTSPFDEQAIEAALRIQDNLPDTKITVLTFGPKSAQATIKRALSMGADDAIWISDESLTEIDSYATVYILVEAIKKAGDCDLILTGRQAADWDAGIVGCGIGCILRVPIVTFAKDIQVASKHSVIVERVLSDGSEIVETSLPCVITVSNELGEPRKASLRETMRSAKKPTINWNSQDLGITSEILGTAETRQIRERLYIPIKETHCELFQDASTPQEMAKRLAESLIAAKLI